VSIDVKAIVDQARATLDKSAPAGTERQRLERVAQEFESMLLVQMLKGMREAGRWEDESGDSLGADSMFETIDVELATHLARVQGLGLSKQLLASFDRLMPPGPPEPPAPIEMPRFEVPMVPEVPAVPDVSGVPLVPATSTPGALGTSGTSGTPADTVGSSKPVDGKVTSDFGWRRDPFTGAAKFHRGIDLRAAYGEDVQAAGEGRVVFSGQQGGYGTTVLIEHADGTRTRYAHLSVALVDQGDRVASGQPIGRAGRSGRATGTHLHFEVIGADGRHMDPAMTLARHTDGRTTSGD
jgi:hypothetical protein